MSDMLLELINFNTDYVNHLMDDMDYQLIDEEQNQAIDLLIRSEKEIQSLRSQLAALQPIKIEDMPDEFKDGREVMFYMGESGYVIFLRYVVASICGVTGNRLYQWFDVSGNYASIDNATHVMLPPTIPDDAKNATTEIGGDDES